VIVDQRKKFVFEMEMERYIKIQFFEVYVVEQLVVVLVHIALVISLNKTQV
jgi:hypothetical protein